MTRSRGKVCFFFCACACFCNKYHYINQAVTATTTTTTRRRRCGDDNAHSHKRCALSPNRVRHASAAARRLLCFIMLFAGCFNRAREPPQKSTSHARPLTPISQPLNRRNTVCILYIASLNVAYIKKSVVASGCRASVTVSI